jgi:hypothetical protein
MTKEIIEAPIDQIGMPLPILLPEMPDFPPGEDWNRHHAFYKRVDYLNGTDGSRAVRFSRLQWAPVRLHNRFHVAYQDGVSLPTNEFEEFKLTVLGYAGYLPEQAVDVRGSEPKLVHMSKAQRRMFRYPGVFITEDTEFKNNAIGSFLISYIVRHGLEEISKSESLIGSFLDALTDEEKINKGLALIEQATEIAAEPFDLIYNSAKKRRFLKYGAPACPRRVIKKHLVDRVPKFTSLLQKELITITG